jgi:hypothetical protein
MAVYAATANGAATPLRQFSDKANFKALALGPGATEFTATDGSNIYVYSRTWSGTTPTPRSIWTVAGVTDIAAIAIDPVTNEIWLGNGGPSTGNSTVYAIAGGTAAAHAANGAVTATRQFNLAAATRRAVGLAYDAVGEGGTPELLVGSFTSGGTRQLTAYKLVAGTPTISATYQLNNTILPAMGRITSMAVDGNVIVAANTSPGGVSPYLQSVTAFTRLNATSGAIAFSLNGPYQSSAGGINSDAPANIAATTTNADQLWVANAGVPSGSGDASSTSSPYSMSTAVLSGSPLAIAVNNAANLSSGVARGVAINESAGEVYVSDGANDVKVFSSTTGTLLGSISITLLSPAGLFWDQSQQRLCIAQQDQVGNGSVGVWTRAVNGTFSFFRNISNVNVQNPSTVWVTTPASGNQQLWVANSGTIASTAGPGAVRIDLVTNATPTPFADQFMAPTSILTDQSRAYVGTALTANSPNGSVAVLSGAETGTPSLLGYFRIAGTTPTIGGLAWCN